MTPEELEAIADQLDAEAKAMKERIAGGTREQWNAWHCLNDAASAVRSTVIWLHRHQAYNVERRPA